VDSLLALTAGRETREEASVRRTLRRWAGERRRPALRGPST